MPEDPSEEQHQGFSSNVEARNVYAQSEAPPQSPAFPGFGQAVLLMFSFALVQALTTIPILVAGLYRHPATLAIPTLIVTMVIMFYGLDKTCAPFRELFPFRAVGISVFLALIVTATGAFILLREVNDLVLRIIPPPRLFSRFMSDVLGTGQRLGELSIITVIVAPLTEEILFRGLILHGFLKRYGVRNAIIGSALLFGVMHGNPWQFVTASCFGILLAWCFVKTRSLLPCIFAHSANNCLGVVLIMLRRDAAAFNAVLSKGPALHHFIAGSLGLLLLISGLCWLNRTFDAFNTRAASKGRNEL